MMRVRCVLFTGIWCAWLTFAYAGSVLQIGALNIPLVEGAQAVSDQQKPSVNARIAVYTVKMPLRGVVAFYNSYFQRNTYLVLGGVLEDGSFDGSVKKENALFALRIYTEDGATRVRFAW